MISTFLKYSFCVQIPVQRDVKNHEIEHVIKKSKFSEVQIVNAIRENESGTKVGEITLRLGLSQAVFPPEN